jgi:hypothetical protein
VRQRLPALLLAGALAVPVAASAGVKAHPFKKTDSMTVGDDGRVVEVVSPMGIGSGEITRTGKAWPKGLKVRLKGLKQLEHFKVQAGDQLLLCVLERPGGVDTRRVCRLGEATLAGPVQTASGFEVALPARLLASGGPSMVVEWVDSWR